MQIVVDTEPSLKEQKIAKVIQDISLHTQMIRGFVVNCGQIEGDHNYEVIE
jgi:hypothetical protein